MRCCAAQVIGALNLAAGLRDAWLAHSPVIALTGGRDPRTKFRKVYQEIDDVPAFEPVTKFNATVDDVGRFPDMLRQAFRVATSGTPGPVHLQFRGNEGQLDAEEAAMEPLCEPQFACVPPFRPASDDGPEIARSRGDICHRTGFFVQAQGEHGRFKGRNWNALFREPLN